MILMKLKQISLTLVAGLPLALASCSKNEPATPTANDANKAASSAYDAGAKTAESAKTETAKAVEAAQVEAAKPAETGKAQQLIDKARSLVAENKFSDASSVLQQLTGQTLSPEQQKIVVGLKEQIQKALSAKAAENAAGAAGDLLKK